MRDLDDMSMFALIVSAGSFTAAAERSGTPLSTLSRRLTRLEDRLGVRLLQRTTRRMRLTGYGATYLSFCEQVDNVAAEAVHALRIQRDEPVGPLTMVSSFNMDDSWAAEVLASFLQRFSGITLHARTFPPPLDVNAIDADLIIVHGAEPKTERKVRALGTLDLVLCASPEYLTRRGTPHTVAELDEHEFVYCDLFDWSSHAPTSLRNVQGRTRFTTSDTGLACQLTVNGAGIALLPRLVVTRQLRRGRLVAVLPEHVGLLPIWMVLPRARDVSRSLDLLEQFLRSRASMSAPWNYPR